MKSFRILHVDDDPEIRDIVELALSLDPAFTVLSCASRDDALAMAADWAPDVILCDVMMPGMDGPAVLARLRESASTAKVPVIGRAGVARFFHESLDIDELFGALEQFCGFENIAWKSEPPRPAR